MVIMCDNNSHLNGDNDLALTLDLLIYILPILVIDSDSNARPLSHVKLVTICSISIEICVWNQVVPEFKAFALNTLSIYFNLKDKINQSLNTVPHFLFSFQSEFHW